MLYVACIVVSVYAVYVARGVRVVRVSRGVCVVGGVCIVYGTCVTCDMSFHAYVVYCVLYIV